MRLKWHNSEWWQSNIESFTFHKSVLRNIWQMTLAWCEYGDTKTRIHQNICLKMELMIGIGCQVWPLTVQRCYEILSSQTEAALRQCKPRPPDSVPGPNCQVSHQSSPPVSTLQYLEPRPAPKLYRNLTGWPAPPLLLELLKQSPITCVV